MAENENGFLAGGLAGAGTGASIGTSVTPGYGTAVGAVVGFIAGGLLGSSQSQAQREAKRKAEKLAEIARIDSITKKLGAQQQAETSAIAGLSSQKTNSNSTQQTPGGFLGSNLTTTAGTFGQG